MPSDPKLKGGYFMSPCVLGKASLVTSRLLFFGFVWTEVQARLLLPSQITARTT